MRRFDGWQDEQIDLVEAYGPMAARPFPTPQEHRELAARVKAGDKSAMEEIVVRNMRLVARIAMEFRGRGVEQADLFQEGAEGLRLAAEHFDPEKGMFSSIAAHWIRREMRRAIAVDCEIPLWAMDAAARIHLHFPDEEDPTVDRVCAKLGVREAEARSMLGALPYIRAYRAARVEMPEGYTHEDRLWGRDMREIEARDEASAVLASLAEDDRRTLKVRFGLEDGDSVPWHRWIAAVGRARDCRKLALESAPCP